MESIYRPSFLTLSINDFISALFCCVPISTPQEIYSSSETNKFSSAIFVPTLYHRLFYKFTFPFYRQGDYILLILLHGDFHGINHIFGDRDQNRCSHCYLKRSCPDYSCFFKPCILHVPFPPNRWLGMQKTFKRFTTPHPPLLLLGPSPLIFPFSPVHPTVDKPLNKDTELYIFINFFIPSD